MQFTPQQVVRMGAAWDTYRSPYWSRSATRPSILPSTPTPTPGLTPTPTPTPAPIASQGDVGSLGGAEQVRLLDNSTNASVSSLSRVPRMSQNSKFAVCRPGSLLQRHR